MPLGILEPFDLPSMKPNCELRTASTAAPQSLMMMNDPFVIQQVQGLATRVHKQAEPNPEARFRLAWQLVFARGPDSLQLQTGLKFLNEQTTALGATKANQANPDLAALTYLCHALVSSNGFLYVD